MVSVGTPAVGPDSYGAHVNESFGHRIQTFSGTAVPAAARVVAVRDDGTTVQASMSEQGQFIVWWPEVGEGTDLEKIVTYDEAGAVLDEWSADNLPDGFFH